MSDQPKPIGEWTAETVREIDHRNDGGKKAWREIANAHNAALADENDRLRKMWEGGMIELERQLSAEERRANDSIEENVRLMNRLAAEREITDDLREQLAGAVNEHHKVCQQQLAAERSKVQTLNALKSENGRPSET